jgi:hypothetical protein
LLRTLLSRQGLRHQEYEGGPTFKKSKVRYLDLFGNTDSGTLKAHCGWKSSSIILWVFHGTRTSSGYCSNRIKEAEVLPAGVSAPETERFYSAYKGILDPETCNELGQRRDKVRDLTSSLLYFSQ